jgi:hypothetical protein
MAYNELDGLRGYLPQKWIGYKILSGMLTSTGTAITFTIFQNTTGVTYHVTRQAEGQYSIIANSGTPFTQHKTQIFTSQVVALVNSSVYSIQASCNGENQIDIQASDMTSFTPTDEILLDTPIEIRIYK